jgi:hypothetical protein
MTIDIPWLATGGPSDFTMTSTCLTSPEKNMKKPETILAELLEPHVHTELMPKRNLPESDGLVLIAEDSSKQIAAYLLNNGNLQPYLL